MIRHLLIATAALSLAACASLAPYGPATGPNGQGYTEQRIEANRYRVTYQGVGDARPVSDLAFRRAAELTLEQGYDWFEVTQRFVDGRPDSAGGVRPSVSVGYGSGSYGGYRASGGGIGVGLNFSGPSPTATALEIVMGRGQKPDRTSAYDARSVRQSLGG
ncbi:MAG TPA: hypothetical protein VGE54_00505 [Brevundimonas sp.]